MTNSPIKHAPNLPPPTTTTDHQLRSPKSSRGLRKLQSAHQLSANYAAQNAPSLISQQRHQQQRNTSSSHAQAPQIPPIPTLTSHHRTRSNSDAVLPTTLNHPGPTKKTFVPRKAVVVHNPREELEGMARQGPQGDVLKDLAQLRHLILCEGLFADSDGMVGLELPLVCG